MATVFVDIVQTEHFKIIRLQVWNISTKTVAMRSGSRQFVIQWSFVGTYTMPKREGGGKKG